MTERRKGIVWTAASTIAGATWLYLTPEMDITISSSVLDIFVGAGVSSAIRTARNIQSWKNSAASAGLLFAIETPEAFLPYGHFALLNYPGYAIGSVLPQAIEKSAKSLLGKYNPKR